MLIAWIGASLLSLAVTTLLAGLFGLAGLRPLVAGTAVSLAALVLAWNGDPGRVVTGTPICAALIAFVAGFPSAELPVWLVLMLAASLPFPPILSFLVFARR